MARYWVINRHEAGQCEEVGKMADNVPERFKGTDVWCTCPDNEHAYYFIAEGDSADEVQAALTDEFKLGETRTLQLVTVTL